MRENKKNEFVWAESITLYYEYFVSGSFLFVSINYLKIGNQIVRL